MDGELLTKIFFGAISGFVLMWLGPKILRLISLSKKEEPTHTPIIKKPQNNINTKNYSFSEQEETLSYLRKQNLLTDDEYSEKLKILKQKEQETTDNRIDEQTKIYIEPVVYQLKELLKSGVLSNEEFESKKEKLYADAKNQLIISFRQQEIENAEKKCEREIKILLDSATAHCRSEAKTKAINDLEEALKLDNENLHVLKFLGNLYYETNNLVEAKKIFQKLIEKEYYVASSSFILGEIAYKSFDIIESVNFWKRASVSGEINAQRKLDLFYEFKGRYFLNESEAKRKTGINFIRSRINVSNLLYLDGISDIDNMKKRGTISIDINFNQLALFMELYVGFWLKFLAISYVEILKIEYDKDSIFISIHLYDNSVVRLAFRNNSLKKRTRFEKLIEYQEQFSNTYKY